jgi:hypothetical protein
MLAFDLPIVSLFLFGFELPILYFDGFSNSWSFSKFCYFLSDTTVT